MTVKYAACECEHPIRSITLNHAEIDITTLFSKYLCRRSVQPPPTTAILSSRVVCVFECLTIDELARDGNVESVVNEQTDVVW